MSVKVTDKRVKTVQSENESKTPPPWWSVFVAIERERFAQGNTKQPTQDGTGTIYEAWAGEYSRQCQARAEDGKPEVWAKKVLAHLFLALSQTEEIGLESELIYATSIIVAWIEDLQRRRGAK